LISNTPRLARDEKQKHVENFSVPVDLQSKITRQMEKILKDKHREEDYTGVYSYSKKQDYHKCYACLRDPGGNSIEHTHDV
jgi:hypothetical protein